MSPTDTAYVVETFKLSADMAARLSFSANRLDVSKSRLIREAIAHYLATINTVEDLVRESVIADFLKQNTKPKPAPQS
jgi:predicted transcriptional regulator